MAEIEKKWYVLKVVTGSEKKIKQYIESEVEVSHLKDFISRIMEKTGHSRSLSFCLKAILYITA